MNRIQRIAKMTAKPQSTVRNVLHSNSNAHQYSEETRAAVLAADAELKAKSQAAGHQALQSLRKRWSIEAAQQFIRQTINPNFVDPRLRV